MAIFPQAPRDARTELFLNGQWVDITTDVYARDGISLVRGGQDETSRIPPSRCQLTLNNRSGNYSPRNPNSIYYGSVGRNTPLRLSVGKDTDAFARTVSSGWGSTDLGNAWSTFSINGTIAASDYNVSGTTGTQSVPVVNGTRAAYIASQVYGDVDVTVTASLSLASILGGPVAPGNIMLRGVDANNYVLVYLYAWTDGFYYIDLYDAIAGSFIPLTSGSVFTGIPYVNGQQIQARANVEGPIVRAKAWVAGAGEPFGWNVAAPTSILTPGWVGVQSFIYSANTNTLPIVFTYDAFVVRVPRFFGEVSYWPQRWDVSGRDIYVPIEASGLKRRLGQGTAPINSAMVSEVTKLALAPIAYWPCEDGSQSVQISALIGGNPMLVNGTTKFAAYSDFACSQPLPTLNVGTWTGRVAPYATSGYVSLSYIFHTPSSEPPDNSVLSQLFTSGTAPQYEIRYRTGGHLQFLMLASGTTLQDSGTLLFFDSTQNLIDTQWMLSFTLHQNGANIDWNLFAIKLGDSGSTEWTGTLTSRTVGTATRVVIDPLQTMRDTSVGHITVRNENVDIFDTTAGFNAYSGPIEIGGDTAVSRMAALCNDANVLLDWRGVSTTSARLGPQRPLPLLTLLEDAADADMGLLHELRGHFGLLYRIRTTLYNQTAALTLDYSALQVSPPLEPVDDDQQTRNDIIAKRTDGGDFELFLSAGKLSITDPWLGGVGTYQDQPTFNVALDSQLPDAAGWRLLLGTVDEARYPTIAVNLANANVASLDNLVMSVNVGDRIVVTNPPVFSTPNAVAQIVRGYTETINVYEHTISFVCAPASPYDVLRAGVSGKMTLDTDGSALTTAVTTAGTSMIVETLGPNLLSVRAASVEASIGDWAVKTNSAIAQSSIHVLDGTKALLVTSLASGLASVSTTTATGSARAGVSYTFRFWCYTTTASLSAVVVANWKDGFGVGISTSASGSVALPVNTWTLVTATATAPALTSYVNFQLSFNATAAGQVFWCDRMFIGAATGTPWVTGAVSLDLMMEGEQVRATNISGATTPQTFTVVRSVNGVVKTHPIGAAVRLLRPATLAL